MLTGDEFERLYVQYENDPSIRKESVPAVDLFSSLMQERASTGRIYIANIDHMNTHGAFDEAVAPIKQSNLCAEIACRPSRWHLLTIRTAKSRCVLCPHSILALLRVSGRSGRSSLLRCLCAGLSA